MRNNRVSCEFALQTSKKSALASNAGERKEKCTQTKGGGSTNFLYSLFFGIAGLVTMY